MSIRETDNAVDDALAEGERFRAALESIAEDRAVYAPELQNIARRALGLPVLL